MTYYQPEMKEIHGFEFSENLVNKMEKNFYCDNIIRSLRRFGAVQFNIDDSPEQKETLELLGADTSYWVVFSTNEFTYYIIRYDIVEVTDKGIIQ